MPDGFDFGSEFAWHPTADGIESSLLHHFMQAYGLASFAELLARSTSDIA